MLEALFWLAIGGLLISCLAAIGAKSLREFSRRKLEALCRKNKVKPLLREILLHDDQVVLGVETLQKIATAVLLIAGSFWVVGQFKDALSTFLAWAAVGSLTLVVILVWIPRAIVHLWAAPFVFYSWRMLRFTSRFMAPLVFGARFFDLMLHRLAGRPVEKPTEELFEAEIRTIVSEGQREGLLEEDAREMIEGVIQLDDADVLEIMTPRTSIIMMHVGLSWDDVLKFVINASRTRIPVYDENRDDIVGVLHVKDLLPELIKGSGTPTRSLRDILRKPYYVPQTKRIDELLHDFQETHHHLAMVLDEYGGVSGLVTIEDVLEEIVGEIVDEYDDETIEDIKQIDESSAEALGRAHLDEINERLGTDLPEDRDFDTIGGFVFSEVGHIPVVGEEVVWGGKVHITVLEVGRRRIERVKIEILAEAKRETA